MLYIRNARDAKESMSAMEHLAFVQACERHIADLVARQQLIAAQPIAREGIVLSKKQDGWLQRDIGADREVQVGYYHILANDMDEAVRIAKDNPEFSYVHSASIEVRPVKAKEVKTGFVYPTGKGGL